MSLGWPDATNATYQGAPVFNRDGIWWHQAPKPRRLFHRHSVWTRAWTERGHEIRRCACGATQFSDIPGWAKESRPRFR